MPLANDPFTALEDRYNVGRLVWASKTRGSLDQEPPIRLLKDPNDGTIRVQKSNFADTRIQVGCQLLLLQGKEIADYQGGLEEIQKILKENLYIEVVLLRHSKPSSLVAFPTKTRGPKLHDPGQKGWAKVSPIPKKNKVASSTRKKNKKPPEVDLPFPRIVANARPEETSAPAVKKSPKKKKKKKKKKKLSSSVSSTDHESISLDVPSPPLSVATIHTEASSGEESAASKQHEEDSLVVPATPTKKSKGSWLKSKLVRSSTRNKRVSPMM